jgi:hypothetical protein
MKSYLKFQGMAMFFAGLFVLIVGSLRYPTYLPDLPDSFILGTVAVLASFLGSIASFIGSYVWDK